MAEVQQVNYVDWLLNVLSEKIIVPKEFHSRVKDVKELLEDDVSGLVDTLTDFAVDSASKGFAIESNNDNLNEILNKWITEINKDYRGRVPVGLDSLAKEYFKEYWKYSSFPVLKVIDWKAYDGILLPTKMFFVDGGSIYSQQKEDGKKLSLLSYDYYIGKPQKDGKNKIGDNAIFSRANGRWFDEYPVPFIIKRGIYHNWKIVEDLKKKQVKVLNEVIPYLLWISKQDNSAEGDKYDDGDLKKVAEDMRDLLEKMKDSTSKTRTPARVSVNEDLKHLIPDLSNLFSIELFAQAERNILAGLGFIDIVEAVTTSRRESILNPKAFIQEVKTGTEDFANVLQQLLFMIQEKNEKNKKYMSSKFYINKPYVSIFQTGEFKNQLMLLWRNGQLSDKTYCEIVGEVEFGREKRRREQEAKDGTEVTMYPHITQNNEDKESYQEKLRQEKFEDIDKRGKPIPDDKTDPTERKEKYDMSKVELKGSPYDTIKELPKSVRNNMTLSLQRTFLRVFNEAYKEYGNDSKAFRTAWNIIKKIARKNDKGKWVKKASRLKVTKLDIVQAINENKGDQK